MKLNVTFILAIGICACFGSALGLIHCVPGSFVATSFDTINFKPFKVIDNSVTQMVLYKSLSDNEIRLVDDSTDTFYQRHNDGSCTKFTNTRGGIDPVPFILKAEPEFEYSSLDGTELLGYKIDTGFLKLHLLISRKKCRLHQVWVNSGGKQIVSNFNVDHRRMTFKDSKEIVDTLRDFIKSDCPTERL